MSCLRYFIIAVSFFCIASLAVAQQKSQPWDVAVRILVSAQMKPHVVAALDQAAFAKGLIRTSASPGLKEVIGRDVLFFSYGRNSKDMLITIKDIRDPFELEVWAYFETKAPYLVEDIVGDFLRRVRNIKEVNVLEEKYRVRK